MKLLRLSSSLSKRARAFKLEPGAGPTDLFTNGSVLAFARTNESVAVT